MKRRLYKEKTGNFEEFDTVCVPGLYQIVLHNDDFTTMEFVLEMLEKYFYMDRRQAAEIMLEAHNRGRAVLGLYTQDVAATKIEAITGYAHSKEFPLVCSMEVA